MPDTVFTFLAIIAVAVLTLWTYCALAKRSSAANPMPKVPRMDSEPALDKKERKPSDRSTAYFAADRNYVSPPSRIPEMRHSIKRHDRTGNGTNSDNSFGPIIATAVVLSSLTDNDRASTSSESPSGSYDSYDSGGGGGD